MAPVEMLICGAGSRGHSVYGRYAQEKPELAKVVAVAEPNPGKAQIMVTEHGLHPSHVFSDWRELKGLPKLAQVAVVSTDDRDHLEPALFFLESGYHVLLEKPMAPSLVDCERIVEAAEKASGMSAVAHVLRYTPYFRKFRALIESGAVGRVLTVRHLEPVNFWHFAHSFVRGNWRDSSTSSPFMLAKCCHDMDILLYLMDDRPTAVQSFGSLSYFRPESAPPEAAERCLECSLKESCLYSASRFYGQRLEQPCFGWPLDVLIPEPDPDLLREALEHGPYGRCVYRCDNNVPDHQIVNLQFRSGATASLTATAFTQRPARETEVMGSHGSLRGDGATITHHDFFKDEKTVHRVSEEDEIGHHLGGDEGMLDEFFEAVSQNRPELLCSTPTISLLSHKMALLAERSRLEGRVVPITEKV